MKIMEEAGMRNSLCMYLKNLKVVYLKKLSRSFISLPVAAKIWAIQRGKCPIKLVTNYNEEGYACTKRVQGNTERANMLTNFTTCSM